MLFLIIACLKIAACLTDAQPFDVVEKRRVVRLGESRSRSTWRSSAADALADAAGGESKVPPALPGG
jgi:hypothetical protein